MRQMSGEWQTARSCFARDREEDSARQKVVHFDEVHASTLE